MTTMTPGQAQTLLQQAQAYQNTGRLVEAVNNCQLVLKSRPRDFAANYIIATLHAQQGDIQHAVKFFKSAVKINPDFPDARYNLAYALNLLGMHSDAAGHYEKILQTNPRHLNARINYANTLNLLGRYSDALASYDEIIREIPNSAAAYVNRGYILKQLKRFAEAIADCEKAIELEPGYAEAHFNRGATLHELKRFDAAIESYDDAIKLKPEYADAYFNRGATLHELKRFDAALESYSQAIKINPEYAEAFFNRGATLHELRRFAEALESYDKALSLKPDDNRILFARSSVNLLLGNFEPGWKDYEGRDANQPRPGDRPFRRPRWLGDADIARKKLLVHCEQGLGDTIQFCRYLTLVQQKGAHVLFAPQASLKELMRSLAANIELVDGGDRDLRFDYHVPLLSLPLAFKTDRESIPAQVPYLSADPQRVNQWAARLGDHGFRIGIAWQGATTAIDAGRSFNVREFQPLAEIPNARLISLQKGEGEAQLSALPAGMKVETLGAAFDAEPDAFLDTAAVMQALDLVITSDTAIAHLAGALGRPVWTALQYVPDWRWLLDRNDSPWYPTMRLFRQQRAGDWPGVFADIRHALLQRMQSANR
jgi:tetratricopeptide (TPR) repeat protein